MLRYSDAFKRQLRRLSRKYRRIRYDLQPLIDQLEAGKTPGDKNQGQGRAVYKFRVNNSDARRGKRGGYRIIYYLYTEESILLVTIYSKTEQSDIEAIELADIIRQEEITRPVCMSAVRLIARSSWLTAATALPESGSLYLPIYQGALFDPTIDPRRFNNAIGVIAAPP
ncbi:MAG: type II toxin-antitoxin system RelE/ParE family toxin [Methylococcales bacterium]